MTKPGPPVQGRGASGVGMGLRASGETASIMWGKPFIWDSVSLRLLDAFRSKGGAWAHSERARRRLRRDRNRRRPRRAPPRRERRQRHMSAVRCARERRMAAPFAGPVAALVD
eukprot:scaffold6931_cov443-Prasinococcus_capsulatus_cf.AAC.8